MGQVENHFARILAIVGLVVAALLFQPAEAKPGAVFIVAPVSVDVTARTALQARKEAVGQGRVVAWKKLLKRLTLSGDASVLENLQSEELTPLIHGYEVLKERTSAVRYLADLSYNFNSQAVRRKLTNAGIPFAETQSRPILIVPVLSSKGVGVLWEDPNPWREAWQNLPPRNGGLLPIVVPYGDLADIRDLSAVQALQGDAKAFRALAKRYSAGDVIVARATRSFDTRDNQPVLEVAIIRHKGSDAEETVIDSIKAQHSDDLIGLLGAGVARVTTILTREWKSANLVMPGLESRVTAVVPIDSFARWLSIRRRLSEISILRRIDILMISKREATMDLWVQGGGEQLRNALKQREIRLEDGQLDYVLVDKDQEIPKKYFPVPPSELRAPAGTNSVPAAKSSMPAVTPALKTPTEAQPNFIQ